MNFVNGSRGLFFSIASRLFIGIRGRNELLADKLLKKLFSLVLLHVNKLFFKTLQLEKKMNKNNALIKENDVIKQILLESKSYHSVETMESLVDSKSDLSALPIQPLYMAIKNLSPEQLAPHLNKFSKDQRIRFLDLDLWVKDSLDVDCFNFWIKTYSLSQDLSLLHEFVMGSEFTVYMKGVFNIWTFDVEDPNYPDHDDYFLTDDGLLLFEFHENYEYVDEIRLLIRSLYGELGVEKAYANLFKMVSDSFLIMQEEEYQAKNYRLAEVGLVDYMESLKMNSYFASVEVMDNYIINHKFKTPTIEGLTVGQVLHSSSLTAFKGNDSFRLELEKVTDVKRKDFLQFNFIRLVNGTLVAENALKSGTLAMTRVGEKTCSLIELGYSYVKTKIKVEESLFGRFDFIDFYRVGHSLVGLVQKKIKKALKETSFENDDHFLGKNLIEFLDYSFEYPVKYVAPEGDKKTLVIKDVYTLALWNERSTSLISILPFAEKLFKVFGELQSSSKLQDHFYLNYNVEEIDFIAILLSSYANFSLGNYQKEESTKMGLTITEFKAFVVDLLDKNGKVDLSSLHGKKIPLFIQHYGLKGIYKMEETLKGMLTEQLEGYDYSSLKDSDFKHVGGPILLDFHNDSEEATACE